ncbi:MAG: AAA family ATPase [Ilumatobacteraceae bacterium]
MDRADGVAYIGLPENMPAGLPKAIESGRVRSGDPRARPGGTNGVDVNGHRLLERGDALAEIRQLLGGNAGYSRCPIVIEGLAGTGKTALLNATLEMGRNLGSRVGRARCDPAESGAPFGVVRQLFSSMFRHRVIPEGTVNDGTDVARQVLRGGLSASDDPAGAFYSLLLLLESTGDEPALLGIDDIQFADAVSLEWLQFLARRLTTSSIHLVMTTRARPVGTTAAADPLASSPSTRRFIMHPLGIESTMTMMTQHFGRIIHPRVAATAHRVTGGNALLIARMLTTLGEFGDEATITEHDIESLASPLVAQSLFARAAALAPGASQLVEVTAVLGQADIRVAADVADLDHADAGRLADVLADAGILGWKRPLEFVHLFERNSVYAAIKPARRAQLHGHAARVLAAQGADASTIAEHLIESDPSGDEWTAKALLAAAQHELESGDLEHAARLLERADREAPETPLRIEVIKLRAEVDGQLGLETAVEHLGRAARLGLDPVTLAEAALDLLDQERDRTSCATILEMVQPARDQLELRRPHLALRLRLAESVLIPAHARALNGEVPTEMSGELASSTTGRLFAAVRAIRSAARLECTYDELIDTLRSLLTPDLLCGGGVVQTAIVGASLTALVRVGAYTTADPLLRSAITAAEYAGRDVDAAAYMIVLAESLAMQGRVIAAEQSLADIDLGRDDVISRCAVIQARFFAALRERASHEPIPEPVTVASLAPGLIELGASADVFLTEITARAQLLDGDTASALANFNRLSSAAERGFVRNPTFAPWRAGRSAALAGLGRKTEGASLARENLKLAWAFGCPITIAEALACVARFQPPEDQVDLLNEAVELVAGTDAELLRCNLLIDLGFARHYAGDAPAARTAFRDGADQATRLGVTRLAGMAGRGLLACGGRPRRLQTSGLESLTPAELRVVKLAADGCTNVSIATSLFINLKTVESHLTRAYKKLGIGDRAELKAALESSDASDVDELQEPVTR